MKAALKLVAPISPKNRHSPRPVKVFYQGGTIGHCKSLRSALANAAKHMLFLNETGKVTITYEDVPVADVKHGELVMSIRWSRGKFDLGL